VRAVMLTRGRFELRDLPMPPCGPGEILVRTLACGICHGDVFRYESAKADDASEVLIGHEGTGKVVSVGEGVSGVAVGDVVTALGGTFSEYFTTTPARVTPVPERVAPRDALGEPIACCVHAGQRFGIRLGDRVAVVGCGFMGLVCLQLARLQGAAFVCAFEPIPWRRPMAVELGADVVLSAEGEAVREALAAYGPFDVVIEAAGAQGAIDIVGDLVRQHGRVALVGYHQTRGGLRTVNMQQWNYKAIDVVNGHVRRDDEKREAMRAGLALMATGRLKIAPLVTSYPLSEAQRAFEDLASRKEGLFKAVLVPEAG